MSGRRDEDSSENSPYFRMLSTTAQERAKWTHKLPFTCISYIIQAVLHPTHGGRTTILYLKSCPHGNIELRSPHPILSRRRLRLFHGHA